MPSPEILPQEQQLEFLVADNYAEIAEMVADIFEEHPLYLAEMVCNFRELWLLLLLEKYDHIFPRISLNLTKR